MSCWKENKIKKHRAHGGEKKHTCDTADPWHSIRKPTKCQMDGDSSRGQGKRLRHLRGEREGQLKGQGESDEPKGEGEAASSKLTPVLEGVRVEQPDDLLRSRG